MPPQTRLAALALAWLLLASVGLTPLAPAAATHAGNAGTNTINDCQAIDQSGTYTLTTDLSAAANGATCLRVTAPDVTLDGQGHAINGTDVTGLTVLDDATNLTVRNLTLRGGVVAVAAAPGTTLANVTIRGVEGTGVDILAADDVTVRDSRIVDTQRGIAIDQSAGVVLDNVTVEGGEIAVNVFDSDPTIRDSTIRNASRFGLSLRGNLDGAAVDNVTLSGASRWDLRVPTALGTATVTNVRLPDMTLPAIRGGYFQFKAVRDPPADPPGAKNVSLYANVSRTNAAARVNATVAYDDSAVDESNLTVWRYHAGEWVNETDNATVDTAANTVAVELRQFSILAPMEVTDPDAVPSEADGPTVPVDVDPPTVTATASPTATGTPTATPTPTVTATASATASATATASERLTSTRTPGVTRVTTAPPTTVTTQTPGQPGFGVVVALVALVAVAWRRRD